MTEVSEMVTTVVLAAISSPGRMVRPMTMPSMGAVALQLARFFSAVSSSARAASKLCWMVKQLALALLAVDAHQHLPRRHLEIVHQTAGDDGGHPRWDTRSPVR